AFDHPATGDLYTDVDARFFATFGTSCADPFGFQRIFTVDGGGPAVDNAVKAAMVWRSLFNRQHRGVERNADIIICFTSAFHGRTGFALSATQSHDPRKTEYFLRAANWPRIAYPGCVYDADGRVVNNVAQLEEEALQQVRNALDRYPNRVAAILLEPIQGEGGDAHCTQRFLSQLRTICDERDVLLIFDEVQTGMGRTGSIWAFEQFIVRPDICVFGKMAQVCGFMAADPLLRPNDPGDASKRVSGGVFEEASRISSTWGGSLVHKARWLVFWKRIVEGRLIQAAEQLGYQLLASLQNLSREFPEFFTNPRGRGLFAAIDVPFEKRDAFWEACKRAGALVIPSGGERFDGTRSWGGIRFRPALTFSNADLTTLRQVLREARGACD
ncbi:MAG: aminotransferase class III-fold pyridoxal phosphate-dependent enzyme, partial [Bdellovibrionales bacterium]|nr:aminotransferase class III-fold pyridoxal phosphate-dependent enzyme [Bdellovibrionales bacterium]